MICKSGTGPEQLCPSPRELPERQGNVARDMKDGIRSVFALALLPASYRHEK
ncbi:hypothetical protein [Methanosarcina sp.]|uniref:hypothetical protein n=1 Tax=Methanosarcina sp. TaxID=2213 RepID=UPI003C78A1BB